MPFHHLVYPLTAIVGQERLKLALILNAIDPDIGGVLFTGAKGTGKSSIIRSVMDILPEVETVKGCVFNCKPHDPTNMCESCRSIFEKELSLPTIRKKMRIVQIPISATEDRVIGTIDVEKTFREGVTGLQVGLLAEANQNILYIDEVNLFPDHLVDMILDSTSSGWNVIEREGVSAAHPSRFIFIGSMNPEEGDLRPQILDRFALHVKAENILDPEERIEIIKRNVEFDENPLAFRKKYDLQEKKLKRRIGASKKLLHQVKMPKSVFESVAKFCIDLHVDGYRPDIATIRAARALAAFEGRVEIKPEDVLTASELALSHRTRRSGTLAPPSSIEIRRAIKTTSIGVILAKSTKKAKITDLWERINPREVLKELRSNYSLKDVLIFIALTISLFLFLNFSVQKFFNKLSSPIIFSLKSLIISSSLAAVLTTVIFKFYLDLLERVRRKRVPDRLLDFSKIVIEHGGINSQVVVEESEESTRIPREVDYIGKTTLQHGQKTLEGFLQSSKPAESKKGKFQSSKGERAHRGRRYLVGKRAKTVASTHRGRYVWYELPREQPWDIALGPTIRAASPYQSKRKPHKLSVVIKNQDIRVKMREYRAPFSIILLVDMSWSMVNSMENLGRAIFSLHRSVYRRRDRVGLIVFKGSDAFNLQQPTTNLDLIVRKLFKVKTSDFTPLAAGMLKAWKSLRIEKQRNRDAVPMLIIVSDGITNVALKRPLSTSTRKKFSNDPQADVMDVARIIARDEIRTFIINTSHRPVEIGTDIYESSTSNLLKYAPTKFLMEVARMTGGSYYGLSLKKEGELIMQTKGAKLEDWFYYDAE